jgi:hypothetical protein
MQAEIERAQGFTELGGLVFDELFLRLIQSGLQ